MGYWEARHPHFGEVKKKKEINCEEMKAGTLDKASLYFLLFSITNISILILKHFGGMSQ